MSTKKLVYVSLFASLTAIGSFISIPLGPVPITLQTLFVLLSGFVLGPKLAFISQGVYILLGLIGLPIFAGMTGGPQSILKPSFGFVLSFLLASFLVGYLTKDKKNFKNYLIAGTIGTIIMYIIGIPYMAFILNNVLNSNLSFDRILQIGLIMFIPGDILKLLVASSLGYKLIKLKIIKI